MELKSEKIHTNTYMGNAMYRNRSRRVQESAPKTNRKKNNRSKCNIHTCIYLIQIETRFNDLSKPKLKCLSSEE